MEQKDLEGPVSQFSTSEQFVNEKFQQLLDEAKQDIQQHLDKLVHKLDRKFAKREGYLFNGECNRF